MTSAAPSASSHALTVLEAAKAMGVAPAQIRQWIYAGCPVVRAGQRGRGHAALLDFTDLAAWVKAREQAPAIEANRTLARNLVSDIAAIKVAAWRVRTDPRKLADAEILVTEFALTARAIHHQLGLPELPPSQWPDAIQQICSALNNFRQPR